MTENKRWFSVSDWLGTLKRHIMTEISSVGDVKRQNTQTDWTPFDIIFCNFVNISELAFSRAEHSLPYSDVTIYIFAISYLSSMLYVYRFLWPLRLGWLLVWCLYKEVYLQIFKCVSFWLHGCCGEWEGWARKPG